MPQALFRDVSFARNLTAKEIRVLLSSKGHYLRIPPCGEVAYVKYVETPNPQEFELREDWEYEIKSEHLKIPVCRRVPTRIMYLPREDWPIIVTVEIAFAIKWTGQQRENVFVPDTKYVEKGFEGLVGSHKKHYSIQRFMNYGSDLYQK